MSAEIIPFPTNPNEKVRLRRQRLARLAGRAIEAPEPVETPEDTPQPEIRRHTDKDGQPVFSVEVARRILKGKEITDAIKRGDIKDDGEDGA